MTPEYQVLARKYRPQTFKDVLGQAAIVQTLKNAIKNKRLAHAYLFCGSRGTGKTTLARVFAKALNCQHPSEDLEPCNTCSSCKEITSGNSLDVLEIDGASHRGIDDVRQINETIGFTSSTGGYKIYIIDEVHMLTKEAFNALLKTLEEPPAKVKFFFATTEPHKILPTILSRCQRFNLNRIPLEQIIGKLKYICENLNVSIEDAAIRLLAERAEGGLRDAESLLDQIIAFHEGTITARSVADVLGVMPKQIFFELDQAGKLGDVAKAFEVAELVFSQGKDLGHFLEGLMEHFRTLAMIKIAGKNASYLNLLSDELDDYEMSSKCYTQEQVLSLLEMLTLAQQEMRFTPAPRIALEMVLLKVLRIHQRLPIEFLVKRLSELEKKVERTVSTDTDEAQAQQHVETRQERVEPVVQASIKPKELIKEDIPKPQVEAIMIKAPSVIAQAPPMSITEDPTPLPSDLGKKAAPILKPPLEVAAKSEGEPKKALSTIKPGYLDTILQFAAVELEGTIQKKLQTGFK